MLLIIKPTLNLIRHTRLMIGKMDCSRGDPFPTEEISSTPSLDMVYKFKTSFRLPPPPGWQKFPLWVGYGEKLP